MAFPAKTALLTLTLTLRLTLTLTYYCDISVYTVSQKKHKICYNGSLRIPSNLKDDFHIRVQSIF